MDDRFFCDGCGAEHSDPADARLGYRVSCTHCAMLIEFEDVVGANTAVFGPAIAA